MEQRGRRGRVGALEGAPGARASPRAGAGAVCGLAVAPTQEPQRGAVVPGTECGETALLRVFAKDAYAGSCVPTTCAYPASLHRDKRGTALNTWDTSGSSYCDMSGPILIQTLCHRLPH